LYLLYKNSKDFFSLFECFLSVQSFQPENVKVIETVLVRKQPLIPFFRVSKIKVVKELIQTESKQPIKEISHQDIYALYDVWEQIQS
jgi:hypothetical protein